MGMNLFWSFQCFPTLALSPDLSCSLTPFIGPELEGLGGEEGLSIRANLHSLVESVNPENCAGTTESSVATSTMLAD